MQELHLVVSVFPQGECCSARNPEAGLTLASTVKVVGASLASMAALRMSKCLFRSAPLGSRLVHWASSNIKVLKFFYGFI